MMMEYDVIVIGGGLLGCFAARSLSEYDIHTAVIERREDICTGMSRANTAIVYTGCDTKPGTLKTKMCVAANGEFDSLCRTLGVRFSRCGSLMVAFGERGAGVLKKKMHQGMENGVKGIHMLTARDTLAIEPNISTSVYASMYAENTGTVMPWELCFAAAENAVKNGAEFRLNTNVRGISKTDGGYIVMTDGRDITTRSIINCAGLFADEVQELLFKPAVRLFPTRGDYYILDTKADGFIKHVIFHEPEEKGKGLTLVPTVDGNIMVGPSEFPADGKFSVATEKDGFEFLDSLIKTVIPKLPTEHVIRSFSSLRPNPFQVEYENGQYIRNGKSVNNFLIMEPAGDPSFISMIGIKTPGLTCASRLGRYAAERVAGFLNAGKKKDFDPVRIAPVRTMDMDIQEKNKLISANPRYGRIVCRCRGVSEGEICDAIRRSPGAVTVDGVKRRTGAGSGRCQGGFCTQRVMELLAKELNQSVNEITKDGKGSNILAGGEGDE